MEGSLYKDDWSDSLPDTHGEMEAIVATLSAGSDAVRLERDGRVVTITLDRPADQNRLTRDVLLALQAIVDRLGADDEAQAVVITGGGREFFSMGILSPAVRATYTKEQILEMVRLANRLYDAIEALPQIVIAALNGAARAGRCACRRSWAGRARSSSSAPAAKWTPPRWNGSASSWRCTPPNACNRKRERSRRRSPLAARWQRVAPSGS